ncbi:MAG: type IV pilus biogenesis/stability protein PilW [Gammaproteobacteria bacterium 28-57-27]|nr:MAG: type IV pilus biogenesis/stability protein PilW [Gammaproteobacteria bacterium 28-57-27]
MKTALRIASMKRVLVVGTALCIALSLGGCASQKPLYGNTTDADTRPKSEPDPKRAAEINAQLGLNYLQRGEKFVAAEKLTRALKDDPNSALVQHGNAILQDSLGQSALAQEHFRRALEIAPNDPEVLNNYGAFLCRQGQFSEGISTLERALSNPLYRTPGFAWANIGQCQRQNNQLSEAEASLRQALRLDPRQSYAWLQLASLQLEQNKPVDANVSLQRYHALEAQNPASLLLGARIEKTLGHREAQAHYELLLRGKFPDSVEALSLGGSK